MLAGFLGKRTTNRDSERDVVDTTLSELAFVLFFVFLFLPGYLVQSASGGVPKEPDIAIREPAPGKPSCLAHPNGGTRIQSIVQVTLVEGHRLTDRMLMRIDPIWERGHSPTREAIAHFEAESGSAFWFSQSRESVGSPKFREEARKLASIEKDGNCKFYVHIEAADHVTSLAHFVRFRHFVNDYFLTGNSSSVIRRETRLLSQGE